MRDKLSNFFLGTVEFAKHEIEGVRLGRLRFESENQNSVLFILNACSKSGNFYLFFV